MPARPSVPDLHDIALTCRRLAEALQVGVTIAPALQAVVKRAPARLRPLVEALRRRVSAGGRMSEELAEWGLPSYVWGVVRWGENRGDLAPALALLADRIELERTPPAVKNRRLYAYSLALGRLGMMLAAGVPLLQAIESAAESVAPSEASDALAAARRGITGGESLSEALQAAAPDLPAMTIDMIRDGEEAGRLDEALPVVADYLLDAAGPKPSRKAGKEVSNA